MLSSEEYGTEAVHGPAHGLVDSPGFTLTPTQGTCEFHFGVSNTPYSILRGGVVNPKFPMMYILCAGWTSDEIYWISYLTVDSYRRRAIREATSSTHVPLNMAQSKPQQYHIKITG